MKLLLGAVVEDETVKASLTTQTVDQVIIHVLQSSKTNDNDDESADKEEP